MNFSDIYNIAQIASVNADNSANDNSHLQQIVLKPAESAKIKIKHYKILKYMSNSSKNEIFDQYKDPFIVDKNINIKWNYTIKKIGEYKYYYLSANVVTDCFLLKPDSSLKPDLSLIYLTIVKKNDNSSIYVFLEYPNKCCYTAAVILDKYLKNYWEIENF